MSYSFTAPIATRDGMNDAVADAAAKNVHLPDDGGDEVAEHLVAASQAAALLAAVVGRPSDHVQVTISGHANPGHTSDPRVEQISVTVRQVVPDDEKG